VLLVHGTDEPFGSPSLVEQGLQPVGRLALPQGEIHQLAAAGLGFLPQLGPLLLDPFFPAFYVSGC